MCFELYPDIVIGIYTLCVVGGLIACMLPPPSEFIILRIFG